MKRYTKFSSLRENILNSIKEFLFDENFKTDSRLEEGILHIVNLISDYKEEGQVLFPEVIVTNDLEIFKTISNKEIVIRETELSVNEFKNVIKLCAPLALGSWVIFIEVKNGRMKYGLVDAELIETSPSIYEQTVGSLRVESDTMTIAYIRNIGSKTVEITGLKKCLNVSLELNDKKQSANNEIFEIANEITSKCSDEFKIQITTFIDKTINQAIKQGHGNLIGVIDNSDDSISKLKDKLKDGVYLDNPIDIADYVTYTEKEKTNESSVTLKAYSGVMISMLNHDGITLISDNGKIIGYHMFIESIPNEDGEQPIGGARTRAFESMINSGLFKACFYKSQDGNSKIWKNNE
ncbi:hypothetical protein [Winogradskyella sediminis]|uniref:hypothetical protein n=1 Tax=Winogradskyella sediminis TaxID=1382466 RepID=UPI000E235D54|nr:hypothetical protein [Winogradskyella sediminis]REG88067.1 hypothetical protein C8N41_102924 [Winogradskyella sediminis]